jgi:hypothetical protein
MKHAFLIVLAFALCSGGYTLSTNVPGPTKMAGRNTLVPAATMPYADCPPATIRKHYNNPDGSCVQLSIGLCGVRNNNRNAALLPWNSEYGPGIRGGSWPSRVAAYCNERKLAIYNVTGEATYDMMKWAALTGRGAAVGLDRQHFQTLVDYDPDTETWYVCDNRWPEYITRYNDKEYRRLHELSGLWCVILQGPPCPPKPLKMVRG